MTANHDAIRAYKIDAVREMLEPHESGGFVICDHVTDAEFINAAADAIPALLADRDALAAEVARLREHSTTLNSVSWKIATALGDIEDGTETVTASPATLAIRLIAALAAARARVADLEAELAEAKAEAQRKDPDVLLARLRTFAQWVADELDEPMPPWAERIRERALELAAAGAAPAPVRITPPDERNPVSGLIGLLATQHTDLSARAKDIARGKDQL